MIRNLSFRTILILSFFLVLVVALLLPSWYFCTVLQREVLADGKKEAIEQLHLVHWLIASENEVRNIEDLQERLVEVGKRLGSRITYVTDNGQVIADSEVPLSEISKLEGFASRPEIVQARNQEVGVVLRLGRTVNKREQIFVAKWVQERGAIPSGALRLAVHFSNVKDFLDGLKTSFPPLFVLIFLAIFVLSHVLMRRLDNPIRAMITAAEAINTKKYKLRVRFNPGHEFYPLAQSFNQMAERIGDHMQAITKQERQLEAVLNSMREGVMVLNRKGKIQRINRALSDLVVTPPLCIGRRPLEVIMSLELQEACDRMLASKTVPEKGSLTLQIVQEGGRSYDVNIVRLSDEQMEMGAVVVFHDITELKRLEKVRRDFVSNVSHELRTPLTSIKKYAETLLGEMNAAPETVSSSLQSILKNTNNMVKMVDDLLQLARLEASRRPFKLVPVNGTEALLTAWKACAGLAEAKEIRLDNRLPEEGIWLSTDHDQLVQVFRNLLENAIAYSPPGEALTVSCLPEDEIVTFSLHDEGPGIPKQHQKRVFERFYRVETRMGSEGGSTGLGLALCRHIIQNHGGRIWVQSPSNGESKGSTFSFTLARASEHSSEFA